MSSQASSSQASLLRSADMFAALGTEARLCHHLETLEREGLVTVVREGTFRRCRANADALERLLGFLLAECCTRNRAIEPTRIVSLCR